MMLEVTDDIIGDPERLTNLPKGHPLYVAETDLKTRSLSLRPILFTPVWSLPLSCEWYIIVYKSPSLIHSLTVHNSLMNPADEKSSELK